MDPGGVFSKWWWKILLIVCLLFGFIHGAKSRYAIQNQTRTWWDASRIGCDSFGGKLLTLKGPGLPYQVSNILHDHHQRYWLGAIEFSTWRWSDGSSLYKYEGYIYASDIPETYHTTKANGNSALQCHSLCKNKSRLFGLQGIRCICLSKLYIFGIARDPEELEKPCPGNLNERCGNEYGISVYSIDSFFPDTVESADCIYIHVVKSFFSRDNQYTIHASNCDHIKCAFCSNDDRIQTWQQNWNDWNRTCPLFKLTDNTMQALEVLIQRNPCYWNGYWIGLRRHNNPKWLDGTDFNMHVRRPYTQNYPRCLAIEYNRFGRLEPFWAPCTNRYIPVCEIVNQTIISPTTRLQVTTHATTAFAKPFTAASSTLKFPTSTDNTSEIGQPYKHKTDPRRDEHQSSKAGVIVGSCIGVIVLLTILVLLALTYRQKRFCFKANQNKDERVYFDPAGDGDESNRQITQPTANPVYSIPVATVRPVYQNMSFIEDNAQSRDEYYNVPVGHKDKNRGYNDEGFDFGKDLESDGGDDHHYEVPKPFSGAHENKDHAENKPRDQIYDSINLDLDKGKQDDKTVQEDNDTNVYCLAGQLNEEEEEEEEKVDLGSETLNVDNCNYGSVWDSTNQTAAPNDDYNTTGQPMAKLSPGNMYSHIRHPQTQLSDNEDAEYAYDTPWFRTDESLNNDYNHTGEFISLHGEGLASCNGNENKEDVNSPGADGVIRQNQQRPNISARIYENTRVGEKNSGILQRHTSDA